MTDIKPNLEEFVICMGIDQGIELTKEQIYLACTLIEYRKKHFEMGHRTGRTFTVDLVNEYFRKKHPICKYVEVQLR